MRRELLVTGAVLAVPGTAFGPPGAPQQAQAACATAAQAPQTSQAAQAVVHLNALGPAVAL